MVNYIYHRPGGRDEPVTVKSAAMLLVSDGVPQWAATKLVELAEQNAKRKAELAWQAGSKLDEFEVTISLELRVTYKRERKKLGPNDCETCEGTGDMNGNHEREWIKCTDCGGSGEKRQRALI